MSERRVNGINDAVGRDRRTEARVRRSHNQAQSAAPYQGADLDPDATSELLRRRRESLATRAPDAKSRALQHVLVGERERRLYVLSPGDLDYIESRGNYVEFHSETLVFISRDSIKRLARLLAASGYVRIQRTVLLNVRAVLYAQRVGHGRYAFSLRSGARVCSGAKYRDEILQVLPLTRTRRLSGK
jgi:DNA-binding LytR/AlgR family response regulator